MALNMLLIIVPGLLPAGNDVIARSIPIKPSYIDASTIRNNLAANKYVLDVVKDSLSSKQQVDLALSYRMMKDKFLNDNKVSEINKSLEVKKGIISNKVLTISLDTSSRANWESGIMPHLDEIPMSLVGKGEQNSIKIKLAMESSLDSHLFLIEEAENHLSFSNLNALINHISQHKDKRQLLITTHNSFVMNKLGVESVLLFARGNSITLKSLSSDTQDYFLKLPGHDTLRLLLSHKAILVEGPSDELIVQKAFYKQYGKMPLEMGIDVISVNSLAFKRFLEIAALLETKVNVITDNDGNIDSLKKKYEGYFDSSHIQIHFDDDTSAQTLESQLLKANGIDIVNTILGKKYISVEEILTHMKNNKTECALKFFETDVDWKCPEYITRAIA